MRDENGVEQAVAPPAAEALEEAVRPAVDAATRLFRVAGAFLAATASADRPWQPHEVEAVMIYGGVLAGLLRVVGESATRAQVIDQLEHALRQRVTIEQAKGMLMEREGLDQAAAFDRLRAAARATHRRVGEVAAELVAGQALPPPEDSAS